MVVVAVIWHCRGPGSNNIDELLSDGSSLSSAMTWGVREGVAGKTDRVRGGIILAAMDGVCRKLAGTHVSGMVTERSPVCAFFE